MNMPQHEFDAEAFAESLRKSTEGILKAVEDFNAAIVRLFGGLSFEQIRALVDAEERRKARIRRLLGFTDDSDQPAWVQRVHEQQIDSFGSGNGYHEFHDA